MSAAAGDPALQQFTQFIQNDTPKIDVSLKNFISCLSGSSETNPNVLVKPSINLYLLCAKALLNNVQNQPLPTPDDYLIAHPQIETQLGTDRLDQILRYKVVYDLREKVIADKGKISKLFGKSYFTWSNCWSSVEAATRKDLANTNLDDGFVDLFLNTYRDAIETGKINCYCVFYNIDNISCICQNCCI